MCLCDILIYSICCPGNIFLLELLQSIFHNHRQSTSEKQNRSGSKIKQSFPLYLKMCFTFTPECIFVRVGVSLERSASYVDVYKLMWRAARSDKGILSLFMPPLGHFNLEMLNILISLFSSAPTADFNLLHHVPFFSTENGSASQRTEPDEEERCSLQGCVRHQQVLRQEMKRKV